MGFTEELLILKRHLMVMAAVETRGPIGISRLSQRLGLPVHKVRYSLRVLEEEGVVRPTERGAVLTKKARLFRDGLRSGLEELEELC